MSISTHEPVSTDNEKGIPLLEENLESGSWNLHQLAVCAGIAAVVGGAVLSVMAVSGQEGDHDITQVSSGMSITEAIIQKKPTFKGLKIVQVGDPKEMDVLKKSGKNALYFYQDGEKIIYWKMDAGILESNTVTITP